MAVWDWVVWDRLAWAIYAWIAIIVVVALVRNRQSERRVLLLTIAAVAIVGGLGLGAVLFSAA